MMLWLFVGTYGLVGVVLAVVAYRRGVVGVQLVLVVPLWPLLAPVMVASSGSQPMVTDRERTVIERFRAHVLVRQHQLEALHRIKERGRSGERLSQLEQQVQRDLEDARRLLGELEERIALAEVAALGPSGGDLVDRQHVEALLARADALVETASSR
jgi:hypothetical protein